MIEGLVMEVCRNYVIVLTPSGEFLKLRKSGEVNVGDVYKGKIYRPFVPFYAAAALLLFILSSFGGYTAYAHQVVGVIDITGDKNVRLYINRLGKIEKVDGLKNPSELKNLPTDKALNKIKSVGEKEGLFSSQKDINVSSKTLKKSNVDIKQLANNVKKLVDSSQKTFSTKTSSTNAAIDNKSNSKKDNNESNVSQDVAEKNNNKNSEKTTNISHPEKKQDKTLLQKHNDKKEEKMEKDKDNKKVEVDDDSDKINAKNKNKDKTREKDKNKSKFYNKQKKKKQ
jgi:hypothetical protein